MKTHKKLLIFNNIGIASLVSLLILSLIAIVFKIFDYHYSLYLTIFLNIFNFYVNFKMKKMYITNASDKKVIEFNLFIIFMTTIAAINDILNNSIVSLIVLFMLTIMAFCAVIFTLIMYRHHKSSIVD